MTGPSASSASNEGEYFAPDFCTEKAHEYQCDMICAKILNYARRGMFGRFI
jgi:hypothetical protein